MRNYKETIKELNHRIAENPQDWEAYYDRASIKYDYIYNPDIEGEDEFIDWEDYDEEQDEEADRLEVADIVDDLNKAIEINDSFGNAYVLRAYFLNYEQEFDKAMEDIEKALSLCPESLLALMTKADILYEKDHYQESIDTLSRAIFLYPDYIPAYEQRVSKYCFLDDYDSQLELADYNKLIELDPQNYVHYSNRAEWYSDSEMYDQALNDYNKAIELDTEGDIIGYSYCNRAHVYEELGDYDKALDDLNKAVDISRKGNNQVPTSTAYSLRGEFYLEKNEHLKAIEDYTRATEYNPDNFLYFFSLAESYQSAEEWDLAIANFEKAKTLMAIPEDDNFIGYADNHINEIAELRKMNEGLGSKIKKWFS